MAEAISTELSDKKQPTFFSSNSHLEPRTAVQPSNNFVSDSDDDMDWTSIMITNKPRISSVIRIQRKTKKRKVRDEPTVVEYKRPKCEGKLLSSFECI
jgi:hypothetical protein